MLSDKFFHGVTARGGTKPPSFGFHPEGFLVGKCAFCSE
jgi:hypothetical protein